MRHRTLKLGLVAATALAAAMPLVATQFAYADYAPNNNDVVGVGSDTLQYMLDFGSDGFPGTIGFNGGGLKYKLVSFDATADANARLAYGPDGAAGTTQSQPNTDGTVTGNPTAGVGCSPGTGSNAATGLTVSGDSGTIGGLPCTLNPTIVLREGTDPIPRPNGSGAGEQAIANDIAAGDTGGTGGSTSEQINFIRSSSAIWGGTTGAEDGMAHGTLDSVDLGTDALGLVVANPGSHFVGLSAAELKDIYSAVPGQPNGLDIDGLAADGAASGCVMWNEVGGTSTNPILPVIPQVGSGTRSTFLADIGLAKTFNPNAGCVQTFEENDPTAIFQVVPLATANVPAGATNPTVAAAFSDAVEPMSGGRLNLFQGEEACTTPGVGSCTTDAQGVNSNVANPLGPYFLDPTCPVLTDVAACVSSADELPSDATLGGTTKGTGAASNGLASTQAIVPAVQMVQNNNAVPLSAANGGGGTNFYTSRPLYVYFRATDVDSTTPWQPGATENWIRLLFYNPCDDSGFTNAQCTGPTGDPTEFGPGGAPYFDNSGISQIALAGVTPAYTETPGGA